MSKFIRSIGKCRVNNIGFTLYENNDGSANIRPDRLSHDLPRKFWKHFDSIADAEQFIDRFDNDSLSAAGLVQKLKEGPFSSVFE